MLGSSSTIRILAMLSTLLNSRPGHTRPVDFGGYRQSNGELAASSRTAVHRNFSTVRLHNVAHQRKSQAAAFGVVDQRIPNAIELFKNLVLLLGGNPNAMVHNFKFDRTVGAK